MRWPPWSSSSSDDNDRLYGRQRRQLKQLWMEKSAIILPTIALTSSSLALIYVYRNFMRRIPDATAIYPSFFRRRSLFGKVTSVGDGDGFRLFHTPGGRILGWGWFSGRKVPAGRFLKETLHIRIAGVDAPEGAHFGKQAQPYAAESLAWLRENLVGKNVRAYIYRRDQYGRIVASVKVRRGFRMKDLGLEMLEAGMATVYDAKTGAEFGKLEEIYRLAEWRAQKEKKGMWKQKRIQFVSPGEYKRAMKEAELKAGTGVKI